jgi:cell wall-associated NlpC family hydrolase
VPAKGTYLIAAGGGAILLWSGFKGKNWTHTLRNIISGKNPSITTTSYPITSSSAAFTSDGGLTGMGVPAHASVTGTSENIAQDAMRYIGSGYVWGGAPGNGSGNWDCSSFCNAVIGRDLGLAIPLYKAGAYHGQSHGPPTGVWLVWSGAFTIKKQDMAPGDLAIWQTHMGIIVGPNEMISALDQKDGVKRTTISGGAPFGEILFVRRLKAGR